MYLLLVTRPGDVLFSGGKRFAHAMYARDHALLARIDLMEDAQANARHDPHIDHDVRRVRQFHADLRHRRARPAPC